MDKDINEIKEMFIHTLDNYRSLEETTFIREEIAFTEGEEKRNQYREKANFQSDKVAVAPNGGAIVMAHSVDFDKDNGYKCLSVYDNSGCIINNIPLDSKEGIKQIHITPEECIVVAFMNASFQTFCLRGGEPLTTFEFNPKKEGEDAPSGPIIGIKCLSFWSWGFIMCDMMGQTYICDDLAALQPRPFEKLEKSGIMGMVACPPNPEHNFGAMIYAWSGESLYLIQKGKQQEVTWENPIDDIKFSPSRKFAIVKCANNYYFTNGQLTSILISIFCEDVDPKGMCWCGNDTVILYQSKDIYMIGNAETIIKWDFPSTICLIPEVDGTRIITNENVYLLRAISDAPFEFAIWNLKSPAVKLFNLMLDIKYLAVKDPIDELSIDDLKIALDGIIEALQFYQRYDQRQALLLALSRAQASIPVPKDDGSIESENFIMLRDFEQYAEKLSQLRVCEQMQRPPYFMPITCLQYENMTSSVLLKRVCNRSQHFDAFRIASFLGVDTEIVAKHWANCLIRVDEKEISADDVLARLKSMDQPLDFIDLASTAFDINNDVVAKKLLEANESKSRGVPLLLKRDEWTEALKCAVESCDSSLILYSLDEARKQEKDEELEAVFKDFEYARDGWAKLLRGEQRIEFFKKYGKENKEMIKYYNIYLDNEEDVRASLKKNKDSYYTDVFAMIKQLEGVKQWIRDRKAGKEEEKLPSGSDKMKDTFTGLFDKLKIGKKDNGAAAAAGADDAKKEDEKDDKKKEKDDKKNEKEEKKKDKKKGKKDESEDEDDEDNEDDEDDEDSEEEKPKKGAKKGKVVAKGKKGKKGKKDESDEDEESEEEKPKKGAKKGKAAAKGKKGKKGKKDEDEDEDEDEEEEEDDKKGKKGKKGKGAKGKGKAAAAKGKKEKKGKKGKKDDDDDEEEEEDKKEGKEEDEEKKEGKEDEKKDGETTPSAEGAESKPADGSEAKPADGETPPAESPPVGEPIASEPIVGEAINADGAAPGATDDPNAQPPKPIPLKDEYDLMTPLELFEQIILFNNSKKIADVQKIMGMKNDEALWKRMLTGIKFNNMEILKKIFAEFKRNDIEPLVEYCKARKNQRAADYLKGLDPDAEAEKKKKKRGGKR